MSQGVAVKFSSVVSPPDDLVAAGQTSSLDFPLVRPVQPLFGGDRGDAFAMGSCLDPPAVPVGLIRLPKLAPAANLRFAWDPTPDARGYEIHGDTRRFHTPLGVVATAPQGVTTLDVSMPVEPLVHYQVVGLGDCP